MRFFTDDNLQYLTLEWDRFKSNPEEIEDPVCMPLVMKFTVEDQYIAKESKIDDVVSVNFEERTSLINLEYFDEHEFIHYSI